MATTIKTADLNVTTTNTSFYTCPASTQAVLFAGTISNIDSTNKQEHLISISVRKIDTSFTSVYAQIPVPYGNTLELPKISLSPGEQVFAQAEANGFLQLRASLIEKV